MKTKRDAEQAAIKFLVSAFKHYNEDASVALVQAATTIVSLMVPEPPPQPPSR